MDGARNPNMDSLASLIVRAKGSDRSMRQFSKEVGVSPATLSRIMTGKKRKPLSSKLLAGIAANADPGSQVTLDILQRANAGEAEDSKLQRLQEVHLNFEEAERKAILDGLIKRGYTITEYISEKEILSCYRMKCDFELKTNALSQDAQQFDVWAFELKHLRDVRFGVKCRQWIANLMSIFYCGSSNAKRISLVIDDEKTYQSVKRELSEIQIPDEISVILVLDGEVKEEYIVPITGEIAPREVFYALPVQGTETSPEEDDWDTDF